MKKGLYDMTIEAIRAQTNVSIPAKVEHPLRINMRQCSYVKVKYRGLTKIKANLVTLFALCNLWMVRKRLLSMWRRSDCARKRPKMAAKRVEIDLYPLQKVLKSPLFEKSRPVTRFRRRD